MPLFMTYVKIVFEIFLPLNITPKSTLVQKIFVSISGFRALYSVEETACGGDLIAESGYFASPGYPNSYPQNAECIWRLGGWPGNKISLTFETFGLEASDNCNRDYVEVHENRCDQISAFQD